jgi:3'(2'), 5'-bisphosphate nucleotidase
MHSLLELMVQLALSASDAIMQIRQDGFSVQHKSDESPLTDADLTAHRIISEGLMAWDSSIPIISEENAVHPDTTDRFWCVDPLDGTRSFACGQGEFTVNIALIEHALPRYGVIACPLDGSCYAGDAAAGTWRKYSGLAWERLPMAKASGEAMRRAIIGSQHVGQRMKELLTQHQVGHVQSMTSARKFCVLAEGGADIYPRFAPTYEWDTAAGHALVLGVGGKMRTIDGGDFLYGKAGFINGGFIATTSM